MGFWAALVGLGDNDTVEGGDDTWHSDEELGIEPTYKVGWWHGRNHGVSQADFDEAEANRLRDLHRANGYHSVKHQVDGGERRRRWFE